MQQSLFGSLQAAPDKPVTVTGIRPLAEQPLEEAVFTVIDLETTGLNAKKNAITEVTAIQFKNGEEVGKYSTLVQPNEPISEEVELLTGISNEMVRSAPAPVIVLSELSGFVGDSPVIVGHNVSFDIGFLREKLTQTGLAVFNDRFSMATALCTKVLAQKAIPGLPSYEGVVVATACNYHNPNPHRAEADVRMSAGILFEIIRRLKERGEHLNTMQDLLDWQGVLGGR